MKRVLALLIRRYYLQKTRRELHALSDHMLRDIGLRRDQISSSLLLISDIPQRAHVVSQ